MSKQRPHTRPPSCVGAPAFDPTTRVPDPAARTQTLTLLQANDFAGAIRTYFQLPPNDTYVYRAVANVTLAQVQHVVSLGGVNGLHAWYAALSSPEEGAPQQGKPLDPPPRADIDAYITLFQPTSLTSSALKALASNAKRGSIRASVAAHLASKRYIHPSPACAALHIPKKKKPPPPTQNNPYFDFWTWSCGNLEWAGPCPEAEARAQSHHVLPVLMHHFGCAVPSYESLEVLRLAAGDRTVVDMGSGNGYWTFMLRQHGVRVQPVDNAQSEWRVNWVGDTLLTDGAKYLTQNDGGKDMVLLMVYPVVGGSLTGTVEGSFTRGLMEAYRGDTVAVVGTQNGNGYTGFKDMTFDAYMAREQPAWTKVVQIPVPSFAGKDEALYVYQRGERAAKLEGSDGEGKS